MIPTKVLIADANPELRKELILLLKLAGEFQIIGQARSGVELLAKTRSLNPDVVLMDPQMPDGDGLEATRRIKSEFPNTRIIILTVHTNRLTEALNAGANKFLLKDSPPDILFSAIRQRS
jgi:two-component system NarL family response regulator